MQGAVVSPMSVLPQWQTKTWRMTALVAILLMASASRILHISLDSFWIDEGFTWYLTTMQDPFVLLFKDVHPPLYFLMVDTWADFTGITELAFRYFSVLPSIISIALIYQVTCTLQTQHNIKGEWIPILASLMLALADTENYLARETRSYTWQVLWILLSMWGFLRWQMSSQYRWRWWGLWLISTIALVYTFYLAAMIGVVQGLYSLLFLRGRWRIFAIGTLILAALSLIPWLLLTIGDQTGNLSYAEWIRPNAFVLDDLRRRWFTHQWMLTIPLAFLGLWALIAKQANWRRYAPAFLVLMWFALPITLTFIANEFAPLYTPRRITMITPAVVLAIAFGLGRIRLPLRAVLIVVMVVYGVTELDFWRYKQPWRDLVADVAPYIQPDDLIIADSGGDDYAPVYHFMRALPDNAVCGLTTMRHLTPATYEGDLPALLDAYDTIWFFYWSQDTSAFSWMAQLGHERTGAYYPVWNPDVRLYRYDRLHDGATPPAPLTDTDVLRPVE
jgi:uncharacterized membrane protein